ncbi:hypothetical protein [Flavobacterium phragmitis]|uniref:Uncharacterized protein n=1 Tax=Flavobacterium phragmitis TaxID=739143 RepID=A0A1I1X228_9FLAO|nr:hypothetical protein [Flavobacterium phragmitis]SFE01446.1 hypothetical protein SAMN05216297_11823 [Flavobacterium phragmitis]
MIRRTLLILFSILLLQSCNVGTSGTTVNENIEKEKRDEIKLLNDKLFKAVMNNDVNGVKALISDKLLEKDGANIAKLIADISKSFPSESYRILDEYNVSNSVANINNTVVSGVSQDNAYVLNYLALNKDMYVSLLIPNGHDNELLITVIYGKYGDEWKINILHFGQYSLLKKTAIDYYKLAQERYKKSALTDAVNYSGIAKECLRPANDIFKYQKEDEINEFYSKVMNEVNSKYTFPLSIDNIETKPKIFRIFPQGTEKGYAPMVCYLSTIKLQDTTALRTENNKVKKEIGKIFPGIDKDKPLVLYRIFNEMPDGKKEVQHYGIVDKIKDNNHLSK